MIIAIPLENGKLGPHFGHSQNFALIEVTSDKTIGARRDLKAPPHEPGLLPKWLAANNVTTVLCGGMGPKAMNLFSQRGIEVVTGAPIDTPEALIEAHLKGTLKTNANVCHH